jgi:sulfite exporter TauE/SafE
MSEIIVAFITGLTTGGLSCLAVQGGLLASSLAQQLEQETAPMPVGKNYRKSASVVRTSHPKTALPIGLFLGAKMVAYTILGLLLGLLGSVMTLNITTRAILLIGVGIFMIGNGLRIMNIHPIFRYFVFEPPSFLNRYIRRIAKNSESAITPLFLGALTVLIPCGVTQAMMAVAVGTGSPLEGAAIMLVFTLGASPVFFIVAYLTTKLGARLEKYFLRFVMVVLLVLGIVSINSGLTLMGSPYSITNLIRPGESNSETFQPILTGNTLVLNAQNNGYRPQILHARAGEPITLNVITQDTFSCARDFVIPALGVETLLPESGEVPINIPAQTNGAVLHFTCSMGMYSGQIVFDQ